MWLIRHLTWVARPVLPGRAPRHAATGPDKAGPATHKTGRAPRHAATGPDKAGPATHKTGLARHTPGQATCEA